MSSLYGKGGSFFEDYLYEDKNGVYVFSPTQSPENTPGNSDSQGSFNATMDVAAANDSKTTIWAQFKDADPNNEQVEINVRQSVFYPEKEGINFITVRGFKLEQAATPWAPPTAEQIGLIGTHWSVGWIIENNEISYSICSGIALGKYGDEYDNRAATLEGYIGTVKRVLEHGWSRETIGSHIVRNNHIHHCWRGIWLDWMAQGARITSNLLHDNRITQDIFMEVNHGPYLVDNNILLSPASVRDLSQGGAYVYNL